MAWTIAAISFAGLVLAGCEQGSRLSPPATDAAAAISSYPEPEPPVLRSEAALDEGVVAPREELGKSLGHFRFTMYYVAVEVHPPDEERATLAASSGLPDNLSGSPDTMTLYQKKGCKPLATVTKSFGRMLDVQGTGKLKDGRVVNTSGVCRCPHSPCYAEIKAAWAMGANGRLSPFRSVAIDTRLIKLGTLLYIPELDGMRMPGKAPWGGYVHDGCVVADDRGGGIAGKELDFFVAKKAFSDGLHRRHRLKKVEVFDGKGRCEKKGGKVRRAGAGT